MKNIFSTIIIFSLMLVMILISAFVFDKFNGFGLIDKDNTSFKGEEKVIKDGDTLKDNSNQLIDIYPLEDNLSNMLVDNQSNSMDINDNKSDIDNKSVNDNNTSSDNLSNGLYI